MNSISEINGPSKPTSATPRNHAYSEREEKHNGHSSTTSMKISPSRVMMGSKTIKIMSFPHFLTPIQREMQIIPPWWSRECPSSGTTTTQPPSESFLSIFPTESAHDPIIMILFDFRQDKHAYHSCMMMAIPSTNSSPSLPLQTVLISYFRFPKSLTTSI